MARMKMLESDMRFVCQNLARMKMFESDRKEIVSNSENITKESIKT